MNSDTEALLAQKIAISLTQFKRIDWRPKACREIKKSEFSLMGTLIHNCKPDMKGMKVSALSNHMDITPAAVTHMVNSLEKGGYLKREADPSDRRIVLVKLTDKGMKTMTLMRKEFHEVFSNLVDHLGEEDSENLARLLEESAKFIKEKLK